MTNLDGHCMCGAITYTCDAEPLFTGVCHCTTCQRQTGTAYSVVVGVPKAAFKVAGDTLGSYTTISEDTGRPAQRTFCTACGSPITTLPEALPDVTIIKAGTLNDTSWLAPQMEIWSRSAQPYVRLGDGGRASFEMGLPAG